MTLIDLQIRLPELLLMRMDKLVMQSSIEARVPFLDHKLIEFVLSIPENIIFNKKKLRLISERGERDLIGSIKNKQNIKILYFVSSN